jgi:hypothetical protein
LNLGLWDFKLKGKMTTRKLRILMLHGRQQNKEIFRSRTTGKKKFSHLKNLELIFVDAPHLMDEKGEKGEDLFMWWDAEIRDKDASKFHSTLEYMKDVFQKNEPIDGIFGFSQGKISKISNTKVEFWREFCAL